MFRFAHYLFVAIFTLSAFFVQAQVTADFTSDGTSGCSPLNVIFADASTGPVTTWQWDFGNSNVSNLQNPLATYNSPGTYTVILTVTDGTNSDTKTEVAYITVFQNPSASFTATGATAGCLPLTVTFDDLSFQGNGVIVDYLWDFGDGQISNSGISNPTHTYNTAGTYPVSLQITDVNGCSSSFLINSYIEVSDAPVASFTADETSACSPPLDVQFTSTSTGTGTLTYDWDFGDTNTSTDENPFHSYTGLGSYTVTLIVTDGNGCSGTVTMNNLISIVDPSASFTIPGPGFCLNQGVPFSNTSTAGTSFAWDFGDGSGSSAFSPSHAYNAVGTYTVTLIVSSFGGCADTVSQTFDIEDVTALFSNTPVYDCQENCITITYTDLSTNAVSWDWGFGNTLTSSAQNPTTIHCGGEWTDTLTVISPLGCTDTYYLDDNVIIHPMNSTISADSLRGCIPMTVNFSEFTSSDSAVVSWEWDFGNGSTSTAQTPNTTYTIDSVWSVTLITTNSYGCTDTATFTIETGTPPVAAFGYDPDTVCWDEPWPFWDLSQPDSLVDELHWYPNNDGHFTDSLIDVQGAEVNEWIEIMLVAGYNGCYDTTFVVTQVWTNGPSAVPSWTMDCDTPLVYNFSGLIEDADRIYWDFGDGSPIDSVNEDPVHTYLPGNYTVILETFNDSNGCDTYTDFDIRVRDVSASFTQSDTIGCLPLTVDFDGTSSSDASPEQFGGYSWDFDDGTGRVYTALTSHTFTAPGTYNVQLVVLADNGCRDTIVHTVTVTNPVAAFTAVNTSGCIPTVVTFTDSSTSTFPIVAWSWVFGDGGTSTLQNPTHAYQQIGTYGVSLTVTDALGCQATVIGSQPIVITNPIANFLASTSTNICEGDSIWFVDFSTGVNLSYLWDFGDGFTSTDQNPYHTYNTAGNYTVSLLITDPAGCDSTMVRPGYVSVDAYPIIVITASDTAFDCYPALVLFTTTGGGSNGSYFWDFGDNATSILENPAHNYTEPGTYDVSVIVTTANGCSDSLFLPNYIHVDGPIASYSLFPDTICSGDEVFFTIDSLIQVDSYLWDFGDGASEVGAGLTTSHIYSTTGTVYPILTYSAIDGCTQTYTDSVYIVEIHADFIQSDSIGCTPLYVDFTNQSVGGDSFEWFFGDGTTSTLEHPDHTYVIGGIHTVILVITSDILGCTDTVFSTVNSYLSAPVDIIQSPYACLGGSVQLWATGGGTYEWSPSATLSDTTISNPWASPDTATQYNVVVIDVNGCVGEDSVTVNIQYPLAINYPNDTTIIIGEDVFIDLPFDPNLIYTWSPPEGLSCTDCPNPTIFTLESRCYTVVVEDIFGCFRDEESFCIEIDEQYSIDVPTAFTPNGDGFNDIIYVRGWGIAELEEFKIYNRWGQLVFETNDINTGWDGYFQGELQNVETYVFTTTGFLYSGTRVTKQGHISLLR
jgi:gliding motility-associated-like protein